MGPLNVAWMALGGLLLLGACSADGTESESAGQTSSAPVASPTPSDEPSPTQSDEPPGDVVPELIGTWDYQYNRAEAQQIIDNFAGYQLAEDADTVVGRIGFVDDEEWWLGPMFDGQFVMVGGVPEGDGGTYT